MPLTKSYRDLLNEASAEIETIATAEAIGLANDPDVVFVDLRDVRELEREGMIPNAFHATRGMIEFWIDPTSPYYKEVFGSGKKFVFYCQSGWRSALATKTVQDMGLTPVAHIEGGFRAWKDAGGAIAERVKKA
jgi:rhodanese-related sulfurtransferase